MIVISNFIIVLLKFSQTIVLQQSHNYTVEIISCVWPVKLRKTEQLGNLHISADVMNHRIPESKR